MNVLSFVKGLFTFDIDDDVIGSAVYRRVGMWKPDAPVEQYLIGMEEEQLIIADILMAYYRTPKGLEKHIKSGDFSVSMKGEKQTFYDIQYLYLYAQDIYRKYDDERFEGETNNVLSI